jgi:hypothetical protein
MISNMAISAVDHSNIQTQQNCDITFISKGIGLNYFFGRKEGI